MDTRQTARLAVAVDLGVPSGIYGGKEVRDAVSTAVSDFVQPLGGTGIIAKGNSVFVAAAMDEAASLRDRGFRVWHDGKFNDIPDTMGRYAAVLSAAGVEMATVMCSAGMESLRAFKQAAGAMQVFGVTVLTSIKDDECRRIYGVSRKVAVMGFAAMAFNAGLDGVVCSVEEVELLRQPPALRKLTLVVPAIRPAWYEKTDDQHHIGTPAGVVRAVGNGQYILVVGRPITGAKPNTDGKPQSPFEAVEWIVNEMDQALVA